jgi:hypothetical protein
MSDSAIRSGVPRVCYYMQTHTRPAQILRLVTLIKEGSPGSVVVIDHDASRVPLDASLFRSLSDVHVLNGPGGYGDFSHLDRYFAAVDWLDAQGIAFDWLQNMTGQDYPLRPIAEIERVLADSGVDGYLQYAPVHPERTPPGADWGAGPEFRLCKPFDTHMRFDYRHYRVGRPTRAKQQWLRPIMIINFLQPWVRVSLGFSTFGLRRKSTIFDDDFICYGGSFFCVLSAPCVRYAREFARDHPDVVAYFRTMPAPDEVFLQTVLVNSGKFRLVPDGKHYIDFSRSHNNHPKTLGVADLPAMFASGAHWARKFDPSFDPAVFEVLDQGVRPDRPDVAPLAGRGEPRVQRPGQPEHRLRQHHRHG